MMPVPRASLAAIGREFVGLYAHWNARLAAIAVRSIGKDAAAAKTVLNQFGIDIGIDQVGGSGHLRTSLPSVKVTARIGCSSIKLQSGKWQFFKMRHMRFA